MVAVENVHRATATRGLPREPFEEAQDLGFIVATIELVADLNQDETAANPSVLVVDRPSCFQSFASRRQVAVQVTNRNDALSAGKPVGSWRRAGGDVRRCGGR